MIPAMNIIAWGNVVPWAEQRQVEQDLIISRAIIDLFSDPFLHEQLRFRADLGCSLDHGHSFAKPNYVRAQWRTQLAYLVHFDLPSLYRVGKIWVSARL